MSKEQYLRMVEQTGEEIDWDRCPPEVDDFPDSVIAALNIFSSLGSRIYPEVGYIGRDYTNLNLLYDLYNIEKHQEYRIFELLLFLDNRAIEEAQRRMKAEYDKIKRK